MSFLSEGFQNHPSIIGEVVIQELREITSQLLAEESSACLRNLFSQHSIFRTLATSAAIKACLPDPDLVPVRSLFFDKTPETNWPVARHQDLTIAVAEKIEFPGFGPWSEKNGTPHVHAPTELLEEMVSLRIHLDDAGLENGALRVVPASHHLGKLRSEEIASRFSDDDERVCDCRSGDILAMRPLLVHASSRAKNPTHRRVLHFEYAPSEVLPHPLRWAEA